MLENESWRDNPSFLSSEPLSAPPQTELNKPQTEKLEYKSLFAQGKVVIKSSESVKPIFKFLAFQIASGIIGVVSESKAKTYEAKATHALFDLGKIWDKKLLRQ